MVLISKVNLKEVIVIFWGWSQGETGDYSRLLATELG